MTDDGRRGRRVAETLKFHLAQLLSRELGDPLMASLVITDVTVTDDLSLAKVHIRLLQGDDDQQRRKLAELTLKKACGRLRRAIAPRLQLRKTPELRFFYDAGHDASARVEELLAEIAREPKADE